MYNRLKSGDKHSVCPIAYDCTPIHIQLSVYWSIVVSEWADDDLYALQFTTLSLGTLQSLTNKWNLAGCWYSVLCKNTGYLLSMILFFFFFEKLEDCDLILLYGSVCL